MTLTIAVTPAFHEGVDVPTVETPGRIFLVQVSGALNALTCELLHAHMARDIDAETVVFDLTNLHEIDSNGLGALIVIIQSLSAQGKLVTIRDLNSQPRNLLTHLGIASLLGAIG
jgi:anti-anti-sigma factor